MRKSLIAAPGLALFFGIAGCEQEGGAERAGEQVDQAVEQAGDGMYEEVEISNGGAIKGKVTYHGRVPMRTIIPTKNQDICGGMREEPEIRVGAGGGVQDAVVYLEDIDQGKAWEKQTETPQIDNKDCTFKPYIQVIQPGDFNIHNSDPILHNTHGFYGRRTAFNLALPKKGQTIHEQLKRPGQVRIECDAHGWMLGWVYVAETPYYELTGDDGSFTIDDVPPGEYTLVATQSLVGDFEQKVTVKGGETATLDIEMKE
ncbi:MAG: carboxypeptidase regulatory-like domain-containing protein [Gammaproteobacteria bacterium]